MVVSVSTDLDCALSYALQWLGTPNLILKLEQRSVIESICTGRDTFAEFVWLPTGFKFGKSICYQTLPFVFDKNNVEEVCCWWQCSSSRVAPHLTDGEPGGQLEEMGVNAAIVTSVTTQTSFAPSHL